MSIVTEFGLRKRDDRNVIDMNIELRARLRLLFRLADSTGLGRLAVNSGARTHAHQTVLYQRYKSGRGPLAANPNYRNPHTGRYGSAHQVQPAGNYRHGNLDASRSSAYAVDITFVDGYPSSAQRKELERLAATVDLDKTVPSEWWHFSPTRGDNLIAVTGYGHTGDTVRELQTLLNERTAAALVPDGIFGRRTVDAVQAFQRSANLDVTGDYTLADRTKLTAPIKLALTEQRTQLRAQALTDRQTMMRAHRKAKDLRAALAAGSNEYTLAAEIVRILAVELTD